MAKTKLSELRIGDHECDNTWEFFDRAVKQGIYNELKMIRLELQGIRSCPDVRVAIRGLARAPLTRKEIRAIAVEVDRLKLARKVKP